MIASLLFAPGAIVGAAVAAFLGHRRLAIGFLVVAIVAAVPMLISLVSVLSEPAT
jgi:uncharacterized membrane protein YfcA